RMTVRHNGVLIHDRVEVPKTTTSAGRPEGPETGPIQLQNHGNPVVYRNIWFVEKAK
ncbi:MAG: petJ, partial [Chthoniobacter sp.]|nr:petJ [Chthoniobacter sp.]